MQQYEKEHLAIVLDNAAECTVLLKSNGAFPIDGPCKIAAYGAGVRYTVKGGTGSGEVNSRFKYTIEQGLENAGFEITTKNWLDKYDSIRKAAKKAFYKKLNAEAKAEKTNVIFYSMGKEMLEPEYDIELSGQGDVAVYIVSRNSGEGSDRTVSEGDVKLTKSEIRDILALNGKYDKFMLVLNVGGVVDLTPVAEIGNILVLSQLGVDCGKVLADILTGKQNPSGKLATTWTSADGYCTEGDFGDWNETYYNEGIYVGYRYFDTFNKKPLFPFGYGLSYTSFEQNVTSVTAVADEITVKVNVKNTGDYAGKEVVQVYVSLPDGKLDKAYQELAGFTKTELIAVGEEETATVKFKLSDLASYDQEAAAYILEAGEYIIRVGNSSVSTEIAAVVKLDETVTTLKTRNCFGDCGFSDIKSDRAIEENVPDSAIRLLIKSADIKTSSVTFDLDYEIDERVKALSDEELAYIQIGNFDPDAKGLAIVGNAGIHVAGAAGETTSMLENKGIKPLVMADGPAGIRICLHYYDTEKGPRNADGTFTLPESMLEVMNPFAKFILKLASGDNRKPKNAVIKEQAATMIPIGTAIAQSFNTKLAEQFGDIVGAEMEMFGVHLWLAPALNIHRTILCGRNFEYYSEDPLVSGKITAAITNGVQKHKSCGTTIKHFAANNQETNRVGSNSHVSERALREIYLKGFRIAVQESQPKTLMTSYNLINGTHTSEHRGLVEDVLRCEFGFKGVVMTDWVIDMMNSDKSTYRNALSPEVAKAGGEIFMPGCKKDYDRVIAALKDGSLSRKQLEINATRVVRMIDSFF